MNIEAGIPQGSPLSPILFMIYNAELLEIPKLPELGLGFIDDIAYGVSGKSARQNIKRLKAILERSEEWKHRHGAQFEPNKYMLVHFTRNKRHDVNATIKLKNITIKPSKEACYLGVIFDHRLKYRSHMEHVIKKGTKFALAMSNIARATWGAPFKYVRRLYTAVIRPRTQYAAVVWHRPEDTRNSPATSQVKSLTSIQRLAMKTTTGCFRSTSTDALQHETQLLPIELELRKQITKYLTRIQTLPRNHPTKTCLQESKRYWTINKKGTFISNLEYLVKLLPEYITDTMEEIHAYIKPPWWTPTNLITQIAKMPKDQAKVQHESSLVEHMNTSTMLCIYTDGSGIQKHIGASAYSPTTNSTTHTVV